MFATKVKVHLHYRRPYKSPRFNVLKKGDWIDLQVLEPHSLKKGDSGTLPLGVSMALPKGFEAIVAPRSSTYKVFGLTQTNSIGVIDWTYRGTDDMWRFPYYAHRDTEIDDGDRVCQFRIQLSQKATLWQKLKWLFSTGIQFQYVESLDEKSRGGFGTTGK